MDLIIDDDRTSLDSVLNVKVLVSAFNQEKALVGVFSVIVISSRGFVASSTNY